MPTTRDSRQSPTTKTRSRSVKKSGKLRIGDHWNAINIIALSQSNPLKAVAEFVENSIDAGADNITIVRGKEKNRPYLRITDDGHGIPLNDDGKPDFQYVATHICDSIKRRLKAEGQQGIRGEFGIGLLSFWTSGYLEGMIDAPFINLTPGTRSGVIHDAALNAFCQSLGELETSLRSIIEQQQQAEEQRATRDTLRSIQKAFHEALLALPEEEYDWFQVDGGKSKRTQRPQLQRPGLQSTHADAVVAAEAETDEPDRAETETGAEQKEFFEHAGPLFSARISPASCVVAVGKSRTFRALPRDRSRRLVEDGLTFQWEIIEGEGQLDGTDGEIVSFTAPDEPALIKLQLTVTQQETTCQGEALITVTDSLLPEKKEADQQRGLPGYTFQKAPGQLWRSRYDVEQNVIVINNAHRDFVFAARTKSLKLRYICRLFSKELVYHNFPGYRADQLLERMIELPLYTEENLR